MTAPHRTFYEFFAGGGMARAGLGAGWDCLFANDFDRVKAETYRANWGGDHFHEGDVHALTTADLPGCADLAWASSPCQDLSLAGKREGLSGARSSAFWGFWRLMRTLNAEGRAPRTIVIENVTGLLTSHGGADFAALCQALAEEGYRFGALEIDAAHFLPQSRPRLFVVASRTPLDEAISASGPFHTERIVRAHERLPQDLKAQWGWWRLPTPPRRNAGLAEVLDPEAAWHDSARSARLLSHLAPLHRTKIEAMRAAPTTVIGTLCRRTRVEDGVSIQRAEVRFDGLAGCLRTPGGGSSRQFLVQVQDGGVHTRTLTPRESARLMGLPESYRLPSGETAGLKVVGDGVAAPVVRWLAQSLLEPHRCVIQAAE